MSNRQRYEELWQEVAACKACRRDHRIAKATRIGWDEGAFVPFPSKGPEPPGHPVRYILLAQEPSSAWTRRRPRKQIANDIAADPNLRNFNGSLSDFLVRWAARQWLLRPGEAFYLTDLGKCSVPGTQAGPTRARRYYNCQGFLDREIAIFRPRAIIPLGDDAYMWALGLAKKSWPEIAEPVMHYAHRFPQNSGAPRDRSYRPDVDAVNRFIQSTRPGTTRVLRSNNKRARALLQIYKLRFSAIRSRFA